ncbi:hypothetical protein CWI39_0722p0010 [Hamiltosporidium magnivora]|uniref:Uncharacterized protein n=1 Tax=Hamiltosporidium magnivora TaxID=148818 RepID=A0A4Q9LB94_9MICR|nr:hypothetical protein CWI39_0722p0010 [Hamiltosporidium magnivora]
MFFEQYKLMFFWSLMKLAIHNESKEILAEMEKAKNDEARHKIVTIFSNNSGINPLMCTITINESTTKEMNKEDKNISNNSKNYSFTISNCVLVSQNITIPHNSSIPIFIDYHIDSSNNIQGFDQSSDHTLAGRNIVPSIQAQNDETSFHPVKNKNNVPKHNNYKYDIEFVRFFFTSKKNIQNPTVIFEQIERIFVHNTNNTLIIKNFYKKNKYIFKDLYDIEMKMQKNLQNSNIMDEVLRIFLEKMSSIKIPQTNCPILSLFPGLILLNNFVFDKITTVATNETSIFCIFYGSKIIEKILQNHTSYFIENSNNLYGKNVRRPDFKLNTHFYMIIENDFRKILEIVGLIRNLLGFPNESKKIIYLVRDIYFYLVNDFIGNHFANDIILRCVLDLVFLFDSETIEYLKLYFYEKADTENRTRANFKSFFYDYLNFKNSISIKFIDYYLNLFQNETFKNLIIIPKDEYNYFIDYLIEMKEYMKKSHENSSIRRIIFKVLKNSQIFLRYNINIRLNSLVFTDIYKEKMENCYHFMS